MRFIFLGCFSLLGQFTFSQNTQIRVFRTAYELKNPCEDTLFCLDIDHASLSQTVVVKYNDSTKVDFPNEKVWGYKDKDGKIYRNYGTRFIRVEGEADGFVLYCRNKGGPSTTGYRDIRKGAGVGTYGQHYDAVSEVYYFSKNLDSKIFDFEKLPITEQYKKDKPCFPERLGQIKRGTHSYSYIVSAITPKRLLEIYTGCK